MSGVSGEGSDPGSTCCVYILCYIVSSLFLVFLLFLVSLIISCFFIYSKYVSGI